MNSSRGSATPVALHSIQCAEHRPISTGVQSGAPPPPKGAAPPMAGTLPAALLQSRAHHAFPPHQSVYLKGYLNFKALLRLAGREGSCRGRLSHAILDWPSSPVTPPSSPVTPPSCTGPQETSGGKPHTQLILHWRAALLEKRGHTPSCSLVSLQPSAGQPGITLLPYHVEG